MRATDGHDIVAATVLRCANCCEHQDTTRHKEDRYRAEAEKALAILESVLGRIDTTEEAPANPPRVGAFEILLHRDMFTPAVLFSKLVTGRFPLEGELRQALENILKLQRRYQEIPTRTVSTPTGRRRPLQRPSTAPSPRSPSPSAKTSRLPSHSPAQTKSESLLAKKKKKKKLARRNTETSLIPAIRPALSRQYSITPIPAAEIISAASKRRGLRELFVKTALSYLGVPYTKPTGNSEPGSPWPDGFHLDCCGLVRQCVKDLRKEFGFTLRGWNQGYQFDTLPMALATVEEMEPGDLVFISGTYNNPHKKVHAHDMVHVEIFLGGDSGVQTIGARFRHGVVEIHDSYLFESKNYHNMKYYFRSLRPWLAGVCKSWCPEHRWRCG